MHSLFQNIVESQVRIRRSAGLSIAFHAFLLALIVVGTIHVRRIVVFRPMIRGSSSQIAIVAVSRGALAAVLASEHPANPEKSETPRKKVSHRLSPVLAKSIPALEAPQATQALVAQSSAGKSNPGVTGQGNDAQNMYPPYPIVSPSPQVRDRSLLPQTDQKIVVDVNLGAD